MDIFQSAVNKLTAWYVAALIMIVLVFSLPTYLFAASGLDRATNRQGEILRDLPGRPFANQPPEFMNRRQAVLRQEQAQIFKQIIIVDIVIVGLGAIASYYFAKRTLRPIEEAHKAQARFTADASHQLRTPLTTMQSEIEVVLRDKNANKGELAGTLASNLEEIARLKRLSDQLLLLTKIDSESYIRSSFSLSKAIDKRATELQKQHGIAVQKTIEPKVVIAGDEALIGEVLTILLDNAVRYANSKTPEVNIKLSKGGSGATLIVADNGPGISDADLHRIFERFYRGVSTTNVPGHGLGLALAQEIVTKHGGTISAESSQDGAVFTILLPLA